MKTVQVPVICYVEVPVDTDEMELNKNGIPFFNDKKLKEATKARIGEYDDLINGIEVGYVMEDYELYGELNNFL